MWNYKHYYASRFIFFAVIVSCASFFEQECKHSRGCNLTLEHFWALVEIHYTSSFNLLHEQIQAFVWIWSVKCVDIILCLQELIDVACLNSNQQMTRLHWSRSIYSCQNCFCFIMWVVLISHVNKYKHSCECDLWWKPAWTILGLWELVAITCLCFFRWAVLIFYMSNALASIGTARTLRTFSTIKIWNTNNDDCKLNSNSDKKTCSQEKF